MAGIVTDSNFNDSQTHASPRPPRIAIIGSGPAGFYAAHRLISKVDDARVDMYEKLPVPFGLVRFGVAPDHPEVKNCEDKFTEVATSPRFTFIGNLSLGIHLPLHTLRPHYDAILFAYGASHDRPLGSATAGLPPNLIHSARAFVGWYNGLPEHRHLAIDLSQGEEALIIGNGNVALDVARVLLSDVDALRKTDIAEHALEELARSRVRRVRLVARRGLMQAAFTIKEARELLHLPGVAFDPIPATRFPAPDEVAKLPRAQKRLLDLLSKGSPTPHAPGRKSWSLDFLLSPVQFIPNPSGTALRGAWFGQMQLDPSDPYSKTARVSPVSSPSDRPADLGDWNRYHPLSLPPAPANANTELEMSGPLSWVDGRDSVSRAPTWGRLKYLPGDFAFSSVGYKAGALPGLQEELGVPFD
ncbi:hypothetical protein KEM55_008612 [Ascosphaera atra]|nr:hypothetical protein KEM55_008612 [Ascosphaera atra]